MPATNASSKERRGMTSQADLLLAEETQLFLQRWMLKAAHHAPIVAM